MGSFAEAVQLAAKSKTTGTFETHRKELITLLRQTTGRHGLYDVWRDFVEMAAISISNACDIRRREEREARYLQIVKRYDREDVARFPAMLAELVCCMEFGANDVLGQVFQELELHNADRGQFFTPYHLSALIARVQLPSTDELREKVAERGFITINDPACGAGALLIAAAEAVHAAGINYQQHTHMTGVDIDPRAAHMSYLQLSLMNIPAVIIVGNSLTLEERDHWYTPAHVLGLWGPKLRRGYALGSKMDLAAQREAEESALELLTSAGPGR